MAGVPVPSLFSRASRATPGATRLLHSKSVMSEGSSSLGGFWLSMRRWQQGGYRFLRLADTQASSAFQCPVRTICHDGAMGFRTAARRRVLHIAIAACLVVVGCAGQIRPTLTPTARRLRRWFSTRNWTPRCGNNWDCRRPRLRHSGYVGQAAKSSKGTGESQPCALQFQATKRRRNIPPWSSGW